ncbi:MAG: polyphenol oxidase family protein [Gemmatimonadales bacterium]
MTRRAGAAETAGAAGAGRDGRDGQDGRRGEVVVPGPVPRLELAGWRDRYGVVAGITVPGDTGFDLGLWTGRPVGQVMGNWRAFLGAEPGFAGHVLGHQVHGKRVRWHDSISGWVIQEGVDGHATATPGLMLLVTVADCIPVYLLAPERRAVALLHAGWRGTAAGILEQGIEMLVESSCCSAAEVVMHCGVGICGGCYEVGYEVIEAVGGETVRRSDGRTARPARLSVGPSDRPKGHLDLRAVLAEQARALGLADISTSQYCSGHDRPGFFSHRASAGADGRMVAYLGIPATPVGR